MKKWRWQRPAWLLAVLLAIIAGAGVWLATSNSGLRSLGSAVSHLSGGNLTFEGLDGALSSSISAQTMRFASDDLLIVARDVQLTWQPAALRSGRLEVMVLAAQEVDVVSPPSSRQESLPASLELPVSLSLQKLGIGTLRVMHEEGGRPNFTAGDLTARLESDGRSHRLSDLSARLDFGRLTAAGHITGTKPFDLHAQAELAGIDVPALEIPEMPGARISATITGNLEQLDISAKGGGAGLTGEGKAQLRPYAPIAIARLWLSVSGLDPRVFLGDAPKASLALQADLRETTAGQLEGSVTVENSASTPLDQGGLPLLQARAHPILSAELFQLNDLSLMVAGGGTISGDLVWQPEEAVGSADLTMVQIDPARLDTRLRAASLSGKAKLSGGAKGQQGVLMLRDKALHMDVSVARTDEIVTLDKMHLRHGRSALTGHGKLGLIGQRPFLFEGKLQRFDFSAFAQTPRTNLNATLELRGELEPASESRMAGGAAGTVRFKMENSLIAEQPVSGNGRIQFTGSRGVSGETPGWASGELELRLGINRLMARGGFGRKGDQLQLELSAPVLAQAGHGFGGCLTAQAALRFAGSAATGFEWPDITFHAKGHDLIFPGDHNLADFSIDGALHSDSVALKATAAHYATKKTTHLRSLRLEVEGSRSEHELRTVAHLREDLNLTLKARGGLKKVPQKLQDWRRWQDAQWLGELAELSAAGQLPFYLTSAAPLEISKKNVLLGATRLDIAGGNVKIGETEWNPQKWSSRGSFTGVRLRAGGVAEGEGENKEALRLGGEWDISSGAQLTGRLKVAREGGDWVLPGNPPLPLGLQTLQIAAQVADGRLTGELKAQGKRLGMANGSVSIPIARSPHSITNWTLLPSSALAGQVAVNLDDISWIGPAINSNVRSSGRLALQAEVVGTVGTPRLKGRIRGADLALALLDQGVQLEQGTLAARFDQESLHMDILDFTAPHQPPPSDRLLKKAGLATDAGSSRPSGLMGFIGEFGNLGFTNQPQPSDYSLETLKLPEGPGSLRASGTMNLMGKHGNLEITASRLPLAQRPDRWIIASGSGRASLEKNVLTLEGNLVADAGLIAQPTAGRPHLPDDVIVMGQKLPDRKGPRIGVEATLDLGQQFFIRASGLEGRLAGQLRLRGEPGQPLRAIGTIMARNANFDAYGQRLAVERGIVNFQGPIDDPGLNVLALRKGLQVEAGVEVTGSVRQPRIRLVSTPVVPDVEKLSWIALGRPSDAKADASLLFAAAGAILGGQSGGITNKISQALGVDELTIRQAGTRDILAGQIGVVGKRLSSRAYISYEQGLTAAAGLTKLTYSLTPKFTVVTRAGIDNAIDVLYTLRFD
ncbi:MAG: translocation/assembly module TamB domain-containing protein [Pseudomonadota bacterium]|nr:translocation/assembly module TamB domain-containing protein [Pseudomonadota bacterium]